MPPKVSIIVAVFNASNFIERCAHSLFGQSLDDIEYVFVNDCTPDDSIEKLKVVLSLYPNRQSNVKFVSHEQNKGTAASRLTGIKNSKGKYIQFVDNDDYIEPDMSETLYLKAISEDADIVVSDFFLEYQNKQEIVKCPISFNKQENILNFLAQNVSPSVWKQIIRKDLFDKWGDIFVEGLDWIEDLNANIHLFYYADKIVKIDRAFYHHVRYNPNSFTKFRTQKHFDIMVAFWKSTDAFLQRIEFSPDFHQKIEFVKVKYKLSLILGTNSYKLRKQYAWLFHDIEMQYIDHFRFGEKLILFFTHYRCYALAQLTHRLLVFKNRNNIE